jgi:8-oxo-dGTP pyrophosphatase MutT (NUDIX family)
MPNLQPIITDATGKRKFACSAGGVLAFIVDEQERLLLLSTPKRAGKWEVVNGALDAEETVLDAVLREVHEEAGEQIRVRPLGTLHTYTFRYDDNVQYMISVAYLLAYEGGEVIPGDDMAGSKYGWFTADEIDSGAVQIIVPQAQMWLFRRAVEMYRWLKDKPPVELQPHFDTTIKNKYG